MVSRSWVIITTVLGAKLKNLAPDARKELPKVGERSLVYLNKAANYAPAHPNLVPSFMDLEAFKVDTDGSPTDVKIVDAKFQGTAFGQCMERTIKGWKFSKAKQKSDNYDLATQF